MSTSGASRGGAVLTATATLVNTAINTLFSAPTQLVAAPGANTMLEVLDATFETVPGAAGNWAMDDQPALYYGTAPTGGTHASKIPTGLDMLTGAAIPNPHQLAVGVTGTGIALTAAAAVNMPLTVATVAADSTRVGGLTAIALNAGGAGYAVNDTGTIDSDLYGGNAAYQVTTVGAAGVVTGVVLTAAGTGYRQGHAGYTTTVGGGQPGVGTGLTVDATTVTQPLGTLYVTVAYRLITTH